MNSSNKFFDWIANINTLISAQPTDVIVRGFLCEIEKSEFVFHYAFSRLDNYNWIMPLKKKDLLSKPPDLIMGEKGNLSGDRIWPQGNYLKRMAAISDRKVQEQVLEIMLEVGDTNNYCIHKDFIEGVLAMPADLAAKWAQHEAKWLRAGNQTYGMMEDGLGRLISHLAKNGEANAALALAAELLEITEDPEAKKKKDLGDNTVKITCTSLEPQIRCKNYQYKQILQNNIPHLAKTDPDGTLNLLCGLLEKTIVYSLEKPDETKPNDKFIVSRPAIEDHDQNYDFYFHHPLINALRNVSIDIARESEDRLREIVKKLENFEWNIFRRIALYLLQIVESAPIELIEERLVNDKLFNDSGVHHEYFHLLKKRFGDLTQEGQEAILKWIDSGNGFAEKDDLVDGKKQQHFRYWQYRRLIPVKNHLSDKWKTRFEELKQEFPEPSIPPDFHVWHSGVTRGGLESPKSQEELSAMSIDELVQYLKEWKPSGKWMTPTPDSLGSVFFELVANTPEKFTERIDLFIGKNLEPTYIRYLICGFIRAIEDKRCLPFESVFKLCKWVVSLPNEIPDRKVPESLRNGFDMDVSWINTKHEICRLFEDKIFQDETGLPFELKREAWSIIESLTENTDPTLEDEKKYGGSNMDPLTLSINSIRGKALHAAMNYAMWLCRKIEKQESKKATLADMPEVVSVLEKHLDVKNPIYGMSLSDRAVYGQWLHLIVYVGADWVKDNLEKIFPSKSEHRPLREAAWNTYLLYSGQLSDAKLLLDIYKEEIKTLRDKRIGEDVYKSPETRLGEDVVILYLRGEFGLEENSLIDLFFKTAPVELTAHVLEFIGRSTYSSTEKMNPEIVQKLKTLWEWRVERAGGIEKIPKEELSTFGWWFAGKEFDNDEAWIFKWLETVLGQTGIRDSNMFVFEKMAKLFAEYPVESLRCLKLFMKKNDEQWFFNREKNVRSILEQGIKHENSGIREDAENIIHNLGARGHLEYGELLQYPG